MFVFWCKVLYSCYKGMIYYVYFIGIYIFFKKCCLVVLLWFLKGKRECKIIFKFLWID